MSTPAAMLATAVDEKAYLKVRASEQKLDDSEKPYPLPRGLLETASSSAILSNESPRWILFVTPGRALFRTVAREALKLRLGTGIFFPFSFPKIRRRATYTYKVYTRLQSLTSVG